MTSPEIKVGAIYQCRLGWYRKVVKIVDKPECTIVRYISGRTPDNLYSRSYGALYWFVNTVISEVPSP